MFSIFLYFIFKIFKRKTCKHIIATYIVFEITEHSIMIHSYNRRMLIVVCITNAVSIPIKQHST